MQRIIPARAGFTHWRLQAPPRRQDHPRSRGVYDARWALFRELDWIIPARAGFTTPVSP